MARPAAYWLRPRATAATRAILPLCRVRKRDVQNASVNDHDSFNFRLKKTRYVGVPMALRNNSNAACRSVGEYSEGRGELEATFR